MNRFHQLLYYIRRFWVGLICIFTILAGGTQTHAQAPSEPPAEVRHLSVGPWTGVAQAAGQATTSGEGVNFLYNGTIQANLEIVVLDENSVEGQWTHNGTADNLVTGNIGGQDAQIDMDLEFSGAGTIGGSPEILQLDGTSRSTGSATISATEGSFTSPKETTLI